LFEDEQLRARGYFASVDHPELGRCIRYPGAPYLFSDSPWRVYRRPPLIGEHTGAILRQEVGLSADYLEALAAGGII
jgi:crotonobetainyl-CoA:carnitine CoA-transferase CaiB-like acyl-CoA transferase